MSSQPKLNFPKIHLRARQRNNHIEVWDELRGMYLVLTPEEWVRRHLIAYLVSSCGVEPTRIVQEYPVPLNGQAQRADVVVVGDDAQPLIVGECKAPEVPINEQVYAQAVRYNSVLAARFLILTNGMTHYCFEATDEGYRRMKEFPKL